MGNKEQRPTAICETDMARLADGRQAIDDLEGLLLKFGCRPSVSVQDAERMGYNLQRIRMGLEVVEKYLRLMRESRWTWPERDD